MDIWGPGGGIQLSVHILIGWIKCSGCGINGSTQKGVEEGHGTPFGARRYKSVDRLLFGRIRCIQ